MTERFDLEKSVKIVGLNIHAESADEGRDFDVACRMIVKALEEIQAYRAIGTVEGYECAIKSSLENYNLMKEYKTKVQEFEGIGTIEEFKALKEKNEPKIPEYVGTRFRNHGRHISDGQSLDKCYKCPNCNSHIFHVFNSETHCEHCGQALDWQTN